MPLMFMKNLEDLDLSDNEINNLKPLSGLKNLTTLNLTDNLLTLDLVDALQESIPNCEITHNAPFPAFVTIQGAKYSTSLTSLVLGYEYSYYDSRYNEEHFYWRSLSNADIKPLKYMTNLTHLDLKYTGITNIAPLSGLTNLTHLYLQNYQISDILPLSGLVNLVELDLSNNPINDLAPLNELTNLTDLYLLDTTVNLSQINTRHDG